jgi:hypothetical protein
MGQAMRQFGRRQNGAAPEKAEKAEAPADGEPNEPEPAPKRRRKKA